MTIEEACKYFGTQIALAKALNCSRQLVHSWMKKGCIPYSRQLEIEKITDGELRFRHEDLGCGTPRRSRDQIKKGLKFLNERAIAGEIRKLQLLNERREKRNRYKKNREDKRKNDS